MSAHRIRVAKDKAELVQALVASNDTTGLFNTYVDVLVFAAALGAKRKKRVPLGAISQREPAPIPQEQFLVRGYDIVIKLLAIVETQDRKILSSSHYESEQKRNSIFEEYVNGGLEELRDELRGSVDYSETILLILNSEIFKRNSVEDDFDLTRFL